MTEHPIPRALDAPLAAVRASCNARKDIEAAWLEGSIARGEADEWSDIDLHLVVTDEDFDVRAWAAELFDVVLADAIPGTRRGHIFLSSEWVHLDVILHSPQDAATGSAERLYLLDRGIPHGASADIRADQPDPPSADDGVSSVPYFPDQDCRVVLYLLGNAVGLAARDDLLALSTTVSGLRDAYLPRLMLAERGMRPGRGAKRMLEQVSRDQRSSLQSLPAVGLDRRSLLGALTAVAAQYVPRARSLAHATGAEWPQGLEEALRSLWAREMGHELP
ncbi:nucleotidyltransferase family protein [Arthrobacter sp. RAF14]|uniref:nucleotidyltransferase family protein n=1 Tax=Arthrobacter sp. RAF14 TaxID=3233051 RepID=UPI003F904CA9